jgi:DNA-binding response OmpR family regulator
MEPPEVLVIDDDSDMNRMMGAYAQLSGFTYRSAATGQAGLDEVRRKPPAVILLDVMLPDVDGFEVCRQLKGDQHTKSVPIILVTALSDPKSCECGASCGADEFITKPFDPDRLMESMKKRSVVNGSK